MNQLSRGCATGIFYTKSIDEILRDKPFNPPIKNIQIRGLSTRPLLIEPDVFEALAKPFTVKPEHPAQ
jgi:hypothetical protein